MRAVLDQRSDDLVHPQRSLPQDVRAMLGFLILSFLAAAPGIWVSGVDWYLKLAKPTWAPPGWLFGPVWSVLYVTIAIAAWGLWRRQGWSGWHALWFLQLFLNAAWSPIFFGLREPGWALAEIVLLWLSILATILGFASAVRWTGWILVPYLLWVSFATALNFALWRLN